VIVISSEVEQGAVLKIKYLTSILNSNYRYGIAQVNRNSFVIWDWPMDLAYPVRDLVQLVTPVDGNKICRTQAFTVLRRRFERIRQG